MNFLKLSSGIGRHAQVLVLLRNRMLDFSRDRQGNMIVPKASADRIIETLRRSALSLDEAAVGLDKLVKLENENESFNWPTPRDA